MANGPTPYRRAQIAARESVQSLDAASAQEIARALDAHAARLSRIVRGMGNNPSVAAFRMSSELFQQASRDLNVVIQNAIATKRAVSYTEVLGVWQKATNRLAEAHGISDALLGSVNLPPISLLGIYENTGAGSWRTLVSTNVARAATEADTIVRNAFAEGVSARELATRLRPYVSGAESFRKAFRGIKGRDGRFDFRNLTGPELRSAARKVRFNSTRIAWSEIHNARAEAEVQHFAADPLIGAVRWTLAPDRGSQTSPDECDVLATSDLWGLGPGLYPVDQVPLPPHPFDRCERVPVMNDEIGQPWGEKQLSSGLERRNAQSFGRLPKGKGVTSAEGGRIRERAERALSAPINQVFASKVLEITTSVGEVSVANSAKAFARALLTAGVPEKEAVALIQKQFPTLKNPLTQLRRAKKQLVGGTVTVPVPPKRVPKIAKRPSGTRTTVTKKIDGTYTARTEAARVARAEEFLASDGQIRSVKEFEDLVKGFGVQTSGTTGSLKSVPRHILENAARGLAELKARGYTMPLRVTFSPKVGGKQSIAWYAGNGQHMNFNTGHTFWKNPKVIERETSRMGYHRSSRTGKPVGGWWASDLNYGTTIHEMGHHLHNLKRPLTGFSQNPEALFEEMARVLFDDVSALRPGAGVRPQLSDLAKRLEMLEKAEKYIHKNVSRYAATNQMEFVAETFLGLASGRTFPPPIMQLYNTLGGPEWVGKPLKSMVLP